MEARWQRAVAGVWRAPRAPRNLEVRASLLGLRRTSRQPVRRGRVVVFVGGQRVWGFGHRPW
eukprot:9764665-Lingulodinium_polyedra.AAC.1